MSNVLSVLYEKGYGNYWLAGSTAGIKIANKLVNTVSFYRSKTKYGPVSYKCTGFHTAEGSS